MKTTAKVFIWIGMIVNCYLIFPVIVGIHALNMLDTAKTKKELTTASWLTIIFCNIIGGICMLLLKEEYVIINKATPKTKTIKVDIKKCTKCGKCCRIAPDVFYFNKNGNLIVGTITEENKYSAMTAQNQCPVQAIGSEYETTNIQKSYTTSFNTTSSSTTNLEIKKCTKCGKCCRIAPTVFSFNENGDLIAGTITEENKYSVMTAQNQCPVHALTFSSTDSGIYEVKIHQ